MDPNPNRRVHVKTTTALTNKGKSNMASGSCPPKHPRSDSPSVPHQAPPEAPQFWNDLQKSWFELLQGTKYSCGRQVNWNAFVHANFYTEVHKFLKDMSWLGLVALPKKDFSFLLVNEFYSGILIHADEYENPVKFKYDSLYTLFWWSRTSN